MTDKAHLRAIVARTVRRFNAQYVGRAFDVPAFTNDVSPRTSVSSPSQGCGGEGATVNSPTVAPASFVSSFLHGSH